jgi:hypothetical protein
MLRKVGVMHVDLLFAIFTVLALLMIVLIVRSQRHSSSRAAPFWMQRRFSVQQSR